ncbi:MAG: NCAIR mutase (PurE)-related protein [Granulosicoccus sp.]|jgi:NCAIR mutase (PurE)-related protein
MSVDEFNFDWKRQSRTGIPEVVFAESKSDSQLLNIAKQALVSGQELFMTRVFAQQASNLQAQLGNTVHYHPESSTAYIGESSLKHSRKDRLQAQSATPRIGIVAAGTSDAPVVAEIEQTLLYFGQSSQRFVDVGVASLWRLTDLADELNDYSILIAVAGMEGALFSVLSGLVKAPVIAVPTSVGYGVGVGGHVALNSALCGCSPGLAVVNIDNGFGAAALAVKMLQIQAPNI